MFLIQAYDATTDAWETFETQDSPLYARFAVDVYTQAGCKVRAFNLTSGNILD